MYAVPTTPFGREDVEIANGGTFAFTVMVSVLVADDWVEAESLTLAVKLKVPVAVGVPEITPDELMVRPVGRVPE